MRLRDLLRAAVAPSGLILKQYGIRTRVRSVFVMNLSAQTALRCLYPAEDQQVLRSAAVKGLSTLFLMILINGVGLDKTHNVRDCGSMPSWHCLLGIAENVQTADVSETMVKASLVIFNHLDSLKVFHSLSCTEFGRDVILIVQVRAIILRSLIIA